MKQTLHEIYEGFTANYSSEPINKSISEHKKEMEILKSKESSELNLFDRVRKNTYEPKANLLSLIDGLDYDKIRFSNDSRDEAVSRRYAMILVKLIKEADKDVIAIEYELNKLLKEHE